MASAEKAKKKSERFFSIPREGFVKKDRGSGTRLIVDAVPIASACRRILHERVDRSKMVKRERKNENYTCVCERESVELLPTRHLLRGSNPLCERTITPIVLMAAIRMRREDSHR